MRFDSMGSTEYGPGDQTSGSEHSAKGSNSPDLSELVNSFLESDLYEDSLGYFDKAESNPLDDDTDNFHKDAEKLYETKIELSKLICMKKESVKCSLLAEVENAMRCFDDSRSISCRELMTRLRGRGLDAGLCKSKWRKQGCIPEGNHEYIDVINTDKTRYIVEVSLVEQFTIARPTIHYTSLLNTIPKVFVGTLEEIKQVVKLMCNAIKVSMRCREMKVAPWRKFEHMKAKWFGSYKRSTKSVSSESIVVENAIKGSHQRRDRAVGFEVVAPSGYVNVLRSCRDEVSRTTRMELGLLAAAFRSQQEF